MFARNCSINNCIRFYAIIMSVNTLNMDTSNGEQFIAVVDLLYVK